jgi:hypothetical protein
MTRYYQIGGEMVPFRRSYVSGTAVACGTVNTEVVIPTGANNALVQAEGGTLYYLLNDGTVAGTTSPGYVPENTYLFLPPIDNWSSFYVIGGGVAAVAHVVFFNE